MTAIPTLDPIADQPISVLLLGGEPALMLDTVAPAWLSWLQARGKEYELILALEGEDPARTEQAQALLEQQPNLRILTADPPNAGTGAVLRQGLTAVRHPLVFVCPGHPDYRPDLLALFLQQTMPAPDTGLVIDRVHLINGFRAGVPMPLGLRILGGMWRFFWNVILQFSPGRWPGWLGWRRCGGWLLVRAIFGLRLRDVACPVHLFRREILDRIPIQSDGPFAHVELLAKANFLRCLMGPEEVPLTIKPPPYRGDARQWWRDGKKVFSDPNFGPVVSVAPPTVDGATG